MSRYSERKKRRMRKKKIMGTAIVCALAVMVAGVFIYTNQKNQQLQKVTAGNSYNMGSGYRNIEYKGESYQYNNWITTILYAGVDSVGKMEESEQYGNKARADTIALVVMDEKKEKMSILSINRDTMTDIRRYTMNGNDKGLYETHLGYAYSYGDGGEVSCENLCEAVSLLMGGIPVNRYVVTNQDSMPYINNLAGGITVTVPDSSLEAEYPELAMGETVTLDDSNIRAFLQYRDTEEAFSNESRMERQKTYLTAYIEKVKSMDQKQVEEVWNKLDDMKDNLQTNITKNQYLSLARFLKETDFSGESILQMEGENREGELHDEFYPDQEALQEKIVELFYEKV